MPEEAEQAREPDESEIRWVGEQQRMQGYCGRAPAKSKGAQPPQNEQTSRTSESRQPRDRGMGNQAA